MPIMLAAVASATNSPAYARPRGRIQDRRCAVTSPPPPDRSSNNDQRSTNGQRNSSVVGICSNAESPWATMPVAGPVRKPGPVVPQPQDGSDRPDVSRAYPNSAVVQSVIN